MVRRVANLMFALTLAVVTATVGIRPTQAAYPTVIFAPTGSNGYDSATGLIQGLDGSFYGTCFFGGGVGYGTVYRVDPEGDYTVLHDFGGAPTDGASPLGGQLAMDKSGTLFGVGRTGGPENFGVVYTIKTDGSGYKLLHEFTGTDGSYPSNVIIGSDGYLYGGCLSGGAQGYGSLYKMNKEGHSFQILHNFTNGADSGSPSDPPIEGKDGLLYGDSAGVFIGTNGAVFSLGRDGSNFTVIHTFAGGADGFDPDQGQMAIDPSGNMYSCCAQGGAYGCGTVFSVSSSGVYALIHSFAPGESTGAKQTLVYHGGYIYGAGLGGPTGYGDIFRFLPNGSSLTVLCTFNGVFQGATPSSGSLLVGSDGNLYGTSLVNGAFGGGTIYQFDPGT